MNKNELLDSLAASRKQIVDAVNDLTDIELIEPGSPGGWSVKDIMAHLTAWEAELVTALARDVAHNKPPRLLGVSDTQVEQLNGQWYRENKDRRLDQVREDFAGARKQLARQIDALGDKDVGDRQKYKWLNGKSLADYIFDYANGHDDEHLDELRRWRTLHP